MKNILMAAFLSVGLLACNKALPTKQVPDKSYYDDHKMIVSDRYAFTIPNNWEIVDRSEDMDITVADKDKNVAINVNYIHSDIPVEGLLFLAQLHISNLGFTVRQTARGEISGKEAFFIGSTSEDSFLKQIIIPTEDYQYVFTCLITKSEDAKKYAEFCADSARHFTVR
jgi:hypothetical protein